MSGKLYFPPPEMADEEGLLAIGGDLSIERLLLAYRQGVFPWYNDDIPLWWHPDPRFVLFPEELKISKSMQQIMKKHVFHITCNKAFSDVIRNCQKVFRKDQDGTWINETVISAYTDLHKMGYAISYEAWQNNTLVGGLYGIKMGHIFFGESMFSSVSNASKAAFIFATQQMQKEGLQLIDCQVYTDHLASLGARMIPREEFMHLLREYII